MGVGADKGMEDVGIEDMKELMIVDEGVRGPGKVGQAGR